MNTISTMTADAATIPPMMGAKATHTYTYTHTYTHTEIRVVSD